jgi:uncharacterized phage infection (PIP) family protein YhgE
LLQALQSDISQLLGGQQELAAALAAATEQEKAEWAEATAQLSTMTAAIDEIRDGVARVASGVGAVQEGMERVDSKVSDVADDVLSVKSTVERVDSRVEEINREVQQLAAFFREMRQGAVTTIAQILPRRRGQTVTASRGVTAAMGVC